MGASLGAANILLKLDGTKFTVGIERAIKNVDALTEEVIDLDRMLDNVQEEFDDVGAAGKAAGEKVETSFERASNQLRLVADRTKKFGDSLSSAGRRLAITGGLITAPFIAATKIAIDAESAFTGVRKTVDATEAEFKELENRFRSMAKTAPTSFVELSAIGEIAGQLGVTGVDDIAKFTKTVADIAVTTNLTSEAAATAFARIANILQEPIANVDRMASVVVDLGNNFATTEAEIASFANRMAGAAKVSGIATSDLFAIGAAMSSVGVQSERGGTAVQKVLLKINDAVATSSEELKVFADTAGVSAEAFAELWEKDAGDAFRLFVEGLGKSGDNATQILRDLSLEDQRLVGVFLSLGNAGDLLAETMDRGAVAFEANTALAKEAETRYGTLGSKIAVTRNKFNDLAREVGDTLAPVLDDINKDIGDFTETLAVLVEANPKTVKALAAIGPVLLGIGTALILLGPLVKGIGIAFGAVAAVLGKAGLIGILTKLGLSLAAILGIFTAIGVAMAVVAAEAVRLGIDLIDLKISQDKLKISTSKATEEFVRQGKITKQQAIDIEALDDVTMQHEATLRAIALNSARRSREFEELVRGEIRVMTERDEKNDEVIAGTLLLEQTKISSAKAAQLAIEGITKEEILALADLTEREQEEFTKRDENRLEDLQKLLQKNEDVQSSNTETAEKSEEVFKGMADGISIATGKAQEEIVETLDIIDTEWNAILDDVKDSPSIFTTAFTAIANGLEEVEDWFFNLGLSIRRNVLGIQDDMKKMDPTHRESPSLVDNIRTGTDQIIRIYSDAGKFITKDFETFSDNILQKFQSVDQSMATLPLRQRRFTEAQQAVGQLGQSQGGLIDALGGPRGAETATRKFGNIQEFNDTDQFFVSLKRQLEDTGFGISDVARLTDSIKRIEQMFLRAGGVGESDIRNRLGRDNLPGLSNTGQFASVFAELTKQSGLQTGPISGGIVGVGAPGGGPVSGFGLPGFKGVDGFASMMEAIASAAAFFKREQESRGFGVGGGSQQQRPGFVPGLFSQDPIQQRNVNTPVSFSDALIGNATFQDVFLGTTFGEVVADEMGKAFQAFVNEGLVEDILRAQRRGEAGFLSPMGPSGLTAMAPLGLESNLDRFVGPRFTSADIDGQRFAPGALTPAQINAQQLAERDRLRAESAARDVTNVGGGAIGSSAMDSAVADMLASSSRGFAPGAQTPAQIAAQQLAEQERLRQASADREISNVGGVAVGSLGGGLGVTPISITIGSVPDRETLEALMAEVAEAQARSDRRR